MKDPRLQKLAQNLVGYSINVQPGENVLIEMIGSERELVTMLVDEVAARGGRPFVQLTDRKVLRSLIKNASEEQMKTWREYDLLRMQNMQGYIGIRAGENANEMSDVPEDKMKLYDAIYSHPVHMEERVKRTKWVVLRYPNASMAQLANTSTEAFEDFYFDVCNLDYSKMDKAMESLKALMDRTDTVRLTGPGTDLTFSIRGIGSIKCSGQNNIPDGEVYTAPVRDSVNGTLTYNTPSIYNGFTFENISFRFENGKIVEATSNDTARINHILNSDEGARHIGEFAIGVNPYILHPMKDTLFDEKIAGSIHFTPGQAYETADNGNRSSIHWDLVLIQRPEYGGGEMYFDDVLVRKDGLFVIPELECLNPEHLK
ncbi:aminopeptidase [Paenibacillus thiaminolyticus]|uniref:Aminopeptidase n=1 Tax=Paenibacillus thiaminolyticus TaxID=49283 RepID=A0AAP9J3D1_PANTH|nr:aminopeptidase [Paenibacillus thiaminolyticus]MCY9534450.1 aminopeptidase [Paenibacillus thiaminolyticus]MCY9601260.1 aminopeptidase [Paenibacillus thiaminolyticus]MCY9606511.1 aminopeptidase [Paenibacillus thiaminolyticus]MCY9614111.1 aminopeptidase [Paenibacillus thiaminolyticus]MCY9618648.1 aminopeptidase [Paenibacillus thiaminolyticus]